MNSDSVLKTLNRMQNDQRIPHDFRREIPVIIRHIKMQDDEINKIRDDISHWEDPDGDPPTAA